MILETERLLLATWQLSDWTALRPIATDTEVMRYITGGIPWTVDKIQSFLEAEITRKTCQKTPNAFISVPTTFPKNLQAGDYVEIQGTLWQDVDSRRA